MKKYILLFFVCFSKIVVAQQGANAYEPSEAIRAAQKEFMDSRYGLFIHWGPSSLLGAGEWVMHNRNIHVKDYSILQRVFYPVDFDAEKWVSLAKKSGMKYITFVTRHHDGFSNWDTQTSNWKITATPYGKDVLKLLAEECRRQNIKLFLYYSLLDWYRDDYPHETGRTGKGTGRNAKGNYDSYFQFMKTQLTELLTNYGPIGGIWLDGHWDQTAEEGAADRSSRINWRYDELYAHIHNLQPQCLIGNNHHLAPFPGEDFQMFERDLPGENTSGYNFQSASNQLPLETCQTINGSWGYNITDRSYKSAKEIIHYLVGAAGRNANLLLNVGPMPNGEIQTEFRDTLTKVGLWLQQYGHTIYGSRGSVMAPQPWGVATAKGRFIYIHWLKTATGQLFLPDVKQRIKKATLLSEGTPLKFKQEKDGIYINTENITVDELNTIIQLETQ